MVTRGGVGAFAIAGLLALTACTAPVSPTIEPADAEAAPPPTSSSEPTEADTVGSPAPSEAVDGTGRRLIQASVGALGYACGPIVFPGGQPPPPVSEPSQDVAALLDVAGQPGVDQDEFFELYDWTLVVDTGTWISLLGHPRHPDRPELYGGTHAVVEFARYGERWQSLGSSWCTATAMPEPDDPDVGSLTLLWPHDIRDAVIRSAAGEATDADRELLVASPSSPQASVLSPSQPARWRLDETLVPDPSSSLLPVEILEQSCASGEPPTDRDITVHATDHDDGLALTVFIERVSGGALCPGNPWYPITVELPAPLAEHDLYDGRTLPRPRIWPTEGS